MLPSGVESVARAMFDTINIGSSSSVDRVRARLSTILTSPPLELATAEEYFGALGPQLRAMLRYVGGASHLLVDTASLTLANLFKICAKIDPPSPHRECLLRNVLLPLFAPFTSYVTPRSQKEEKVDWEGSCPQAVLLPSGGRVLYSEDDVLGAAEDLHKVLSVAPPTHAVARLLAPSLPALLDLYTVYTQATLRKGSASASKELLARILSVLPASEGARICGKIVGLPPTCLRKVCAGQDDGTQSNEFLSLSRLPNLAYVLGENAGFTLARFPGPVTWKGVSLESDAPPPLSSLLLFPPRPSLPVKNGNVSKKSGVLESLFSISSGSQSKESDCRGGNFQYSEGLGGVNNPRAEESNSRINSLVDILSMIPAPKKGVAALSISGILFTGLLEWQTQFVLSGGRGEEEDAIPPLQLAVCLSERLGPRLLHNELQCTQAVRHSLLLAVLSTGLSIPGALEAGCGDDDTEASKIHLEGLRKHAQAAITPGVSNALEIALKQPSVSPSLDCPDTEELLSTCLGLLTILLTTTYSMEEEGAGTKDISSEMEASQVRIAKNVWLRSTLPLLMALAEHPNEELSETATALRALILTRSVEPTEQRLPTTTYSATTKSVSQKQGRSPGEVSSCSLNSHADLKTAMELVMDPEPAVLSHGLRALAQAVKCGALGKPTVGTQYGESYPKANLMEGDDTQGNEVNNNRSNNKAMVSSLLDLSMKNLASHDSYVYLASVDLLQALSSSPHAPHVLPRLLREYSGSVSAPYAPRVRVKIGEALSLVSRNMGRSGILPIYAQSLLGCLLSVGPGGWKSQEALIQRLIAKEGSVVSSHYQEQSLEEPSVAHFFPPGTSIRDMFNPFNVALALKDACELRASAICTVGEVALFLGSSLATHCLDLVGGLSGVLVMERFPLKKCSRSGEGEGEGERDRAIVEMVAGVRRAAALALRRLMEGPGALSSLAGKGRMRELLACLQASSELDEDAKVRAHAKDALAFISDAVDRLAGVF